MLRGRLNADLNDLSEIFGHTHCKICLYPLRGNIYIFVELQPLKHKVWLSNSFTTVARLKLKRKAEMLRSPGWSALKTS